MNIIKNIFRATLVFALSLSICGCSAGYINENQGDTISPVQDSSSASSSILSMPLYFRYYDEPMLTRNELNVEIDNQNLPEYFAVNALLAGAPGQRPELTSCFKKNTTLLNVEGNGKCLYVTLSAGFLTDTVGTNDDETHLSRKLAIYSIVNTVCEMGSFAFVQLYIRQNGVDYRLDSFENGIAKNESEATLLGPLSRNTELILTPSNVAKMTLTHYSKLEWEEMYLYLGNKENAVEKLPLVEELSQRLNYLGLNMSEFSVSENYTVSDDGKSAVVQVTFRITTQNSAYTVTNVPLELVCKSRVWLVSYESLMGFLEV